MKPDAEFPWDDTLTGSGKKPPLLRNISRPRSSRRKRRENRSSSTSTFKTRTGRFPARSRRRQKLRTRRKPGRGGKRAAAKPRNAAKRAGAKTDGLARVYQPAEVTVPPFLEDIPPVREEVAQYFTGVARFDVALTGILAALAESGHADDTIIFFASDHGMSFPFSKATVYYNGTRSPAILKYPGMPPATTHDELVSSVDIMPTLLELLAVPAPADMDGRSWLPLVRGESQAGRDYVITHVNTVSSGASFPQRCIRTKDHALMFHAWPDGTEEFRVEAMSGITFKSLVEAGRTDERIAARVKQLRIGQPLAFFDEHADAGERTNLIDSPNSRTEARAAGRDSSCSHGKNSRPADREFREGAGRVAHRREELSGQNPVRTLSVRAPVALSMKFRRRRQAVPSTESPPSVEGDFPDSLTRPICHGRVDRNPGG